MVETLDAVRCALEVAEVTIADMDPHFWLVGRLTVYPNQASVNRLTFDRQTAEATPSMLIGDYTSTTM